MIEDLVVQIILILPRPLMSTLSSMRNSLNSLILSRYIEQSTSFLEKNKRYEPEESMFELPKGRINVTIFADPCDITGQTDPASVG